VSRWCERTARKVAVFENHFKEETRLWLCDDHMVEFADPEFRRKALDRTLDTLGVLSDSGRLKVPIKTMHGHPAQVALFKHQEECDACQRVREWITAEAHHGRINNQADIDRVGRYVIEHACPIGVELNHAVGMAMQGG